MSDIEVGFDLGEFSSSSRLLCAVTTRAGRVLWANDTLGRAYGPETEAMIGRPFVELLDTSARTGATQAMARLRGAADEVAFQARLHPLAGGFHAEWSCRVGRDGLLYVLGIEAEPKERDESAESVDSETTELREQMARDHLTGTANRRTFEVALDHQLDRCRRDGLPLSVALVDVDGFKRYNDTYGHLAGDECLVRVARALQQRTSRTGELVGRFGGDEFLVLWPGIGMATAQRHANRIRDAVRVLDLRVADKPLHVTVSIGGITMVPLRRTTPTELVHAADRAMYAVKRAGGDSTRWVTDPGHVHKGERAAP